MSPADRLSQALALMQKALQLLDDAAAAPHVGANLDLAICHLRDEIAARIPPRAPELRTTND
jgi:hypothetical protein